MTTVESTSTDPTAPTWPNSAANNCTDVGDFFKSDETSRPHVQAVFGIFYSMIFVAGILGNGLVIASVWRYPALQSVRNFFIVSLSCSDIVVCLTSLPITPVTLIKKNWIFGSFLCYAFPLFQGMSVCISTFTLTAVAVDRYILIIFPTRRPIQRAQAVPMIVGIWALAAVVCLPMVAHYTYYYGPDRVDDPYEFHTPLPPFNHTDQTPTVATDWIDTSTITETSPVYEFTPLFCGYFCDERWPSERVQKIYGTFVLILQFLVPLTVIAFCYSHIWCRLVSSAKMKKANQAVKLNKAARAGGLSPSGRGSASTSTAAEARQQAVLRRKRRTNRMLIAMVFVFACSWCPQVTMNLLRDLSLQWLQSFIFGNMYFYSLLCHSIAMTSTVWNPLLYSFMNSAFRNAFSELIPCLAGIHRTFSGRRTETQREKKRLCQPDADSNLVRHGAEGETLAGSGNVASTTTAIRPIPGTSPDGVSRVGCNATATETSALLPVGTVRSASQKTKSIRPSNGVNVANGDGVRMHTYNL